VPLIIGGTACERRSPPGASTLITSAPSAPSSLVAHGPTAAIVRSKTRMPSRIFATSSSTSGSLSPRNEESSNLAESVIGLDGRTRLSAGRLVRVVGAQRAYLGG